MPVQVIIPSALQSYTRSSRVQAEGATLAELLAALDQRYPGLRFRMVDEQDRLRPHMRVFVAGQAVQALDFVLPPGQDVAIVQALSGG